MAKPSKTAPGDLLPSEAPEWKLLSMYVDTYRHHFDLFIKAYLIYLAIMGVVAGFVFTRELEPLAKSLLLGLGVLASALATTSWLTGLFYAQAFARRVDALCEAIGIGSLPMFASKVVLFLGTLGSLAMTCAGAYLIYRRGDF